MASLITKWKKGNPYIYWVRSARVNGKPRIVEQVYLGPRARVMQEIYEHFTADKKEQGDRVASGVYFYQLRTGNFAAMRRLILLK